jgi:hypothetical protein
VTTLVLLSLFFFIAIFLLSKKFSFLKIIISLSFLLYILLISSDQYERFEIENEMIKFDDNKDGFYSKDEITPKFLKLERELISDTGSNLFILIGYPICLAYIILISLLFKILQFINTKIRQN